MHLGVAAIERRQAGKASKANIFALGINLQRVLTEITPHDCAEPGQLAGGAFGFSGIAQRVPAIIFQRESNMRIGHGETLDRVSHSHAFGALAFHELQPGGSRIEQVAHFDAGASLAAPGKRRRARAFHPSRLNKDFGCVFAGRAG